MNVLLDQELSADHQARIRDGLRDYDNQCIEDERMAQDLANRYESVRRQEEEQIARLLDTMFQSEQRLICTIQGGRLNDDDVANCSHAAVTIARARSVIQEMIR